MQTKPPVYVFYVIVISQFCCTSLWFAVNAVLPQLQSEFHWPVESLGYTTSAIQLGFIIGTLTFALLGLSDRLSPSFLFFISSLLGAAANAMILLERSSIELNLISRCATGFFLAGVYPVGMKIASDWNKEGLGHWLGALVGALVLGTAFPHGLKLIPGFVDPYILVVSVSVLAVSGGLAMWLFVQDGPFHKASSRFSFREVHGVFRYNTFRAAALGYFGHMWEVYAFWAFVPVVLLFYQQQTPVEFSASGWSFAVIASGFLGCLLGGKLSLIYGSKTIASIALVASAICCLVSPWFFEMPFPVFMSLMMFWGFMVVADSPQFSALVASHAPSHIRGSAITMTTCIGFAITIVSIQLLNFSLHLIATPYLLLLLAPGPVLGLIFLHQQKLSSWIK
jgi:MFS family permease